MIKVMAPVKPFTIVVLVGINMGSNPKISLVFNRLGLKRSRDKSN